MSPRNRDQHIIICWNYFTTRAGHWASLSIFHKHLLGVHVLGMIPLWRELVGRAVESLPQGSIELEVKHWVIGPRVLIKDLNEVVLRFRFIASEDERIVASIGIYRVRKGHQLKGLCK
jgi:hypothetical protein